MTDNTLWLAEQEANRYYTFIESLGVGSDVSILSPYNGNITKSVVKSVVGSKVTCENGMTFEYGTEVKTGGYKFHKILSSKQVRAMEK